jgi:TetR/AcrR family transcriptional repressor of nem operon
MKVSKAKAAENRDTILDAAARLFRERGLAEVGVDALSAEAGLSHGSVYSQFGSKEKLMVQAMEHGFAKNAARADELTTFEDFLANYLSPRHRDSRGRGCIISALSCEMPRQSRSLRKIFTDGFRRAVRRIGAKLPGRDDTAREDDALALFASMVGAVVLARAVDDPQLSDRILSVNHQRLLQQSQNRAAGPG